MKPTETEKLIMQQIWAKCTFLPGSFDKKMVRDFKPDGDLSPLQKWYVYWLCHRYRKKLRNDVLVTIADNYLTTHPKPLSRKEAQRVLKGNSVPGKPEVLKIKLPAVKHMAQLKIGFTPF